MSTRHYLTLKSHGAIVPGPFNGSWDQSFSTGPSSAGGRGLNRGLVEWAFILDTSKTDGGKQGSTWNVREENSTANWDTAFIRWATKPLEAQSISGTFNLCGYADCIVDGGLGADVVWHVHIYILKADGTVGAVLLNNYIDTNVWNPFSSEGKGIASAQTLSTQSCAAGDRVVVELGVRFQPNTGDDTIARLAGGTLDSGGSPLTDAVAGGLGGSVSWVEWSHAFVEQTPVAAPVNDACADATVIPSVLAPYTAELDTTGSTDTDHAVWWQWTANRTGKIEISTLGSNYWAVVHAYTGSCGSLASVSGQSGEDNLWTQRSTNVHTVPVSSGVTYRFKVASSSIPGLDAGQGGELHLSVAYQESIADEDIVVDAQSIVVYRDGVAVRVDHDFHGLTPTGSAIDYTRRPIFDLLGDDGVPNVHRRLYVALFGDSPLIEVIDLETLDDEVGDTNFIFSSLQDGGRNIASLVFDPIGRIVIGYFGDNYDVLGQLPTDPNTGYIRRGDAVTTLDDWDPDRDPTAFEIFPVEFENSGAEYVEVDVTGDIVYYTSAGRRILAYNMATRTQLPDFALLPAQPGTLRPGAHGLRLLPPGDGSGGMLVAYGDVVHRLDASGTVIQSYTPSDTARAQDLDKVEISADRTLFSVSDQLSTSVFTFNIATGEQVGDVSTGLPDGQLSGFSVVGGYRAGVEAHVVPITPFRPLRGTLIDNSIPCCDDTPVGPGEPEVVPPFILPGWQSHCVGGGEVEQVADLVESESWIR